MGWGKAESAHAEGAERCAKGARKVEDPRLLAWVFFIFYCFKDSRLKGVKWTFCFWTHVAWNVEDGAFAQS